MRSPFAAILALTVALAGVPSHARDAISPTRIPPSGVIGVGAAQLTPQFWIHQLAHPGSVLLDRAAIAAQNAKLLRVDASMHDLGRLPPALDKATVRGWIEALSKRPEHPRYDVHGAPLPAAKMDAIIANMALGAIPATQPTRFGLVVHRANLRTFPTTLRVFSEKGDTDIDRFQESGIFPGTPVVIAHTSADRDWLFVVSPRYAAWMPARHVAEGSRAQVLGYAAGKPYRVITGATVNTVFTREQPAVSQLQLDMGVRVPLAIGLHADQPVNGQTAYAAWTLQLPMRGADGKLQFTPALLQKNADSAPDYLPLTRANIIRQAFRFLGERYGWGHAYDARDCSGFVSDVYRSMGVQMPRNTSAQSVSQAFDHTLFTNADSRAQRLAAVARLQVGDLIFIPGHVMMMIGRIHGQPYVIHDVLGMSYHAPDGSRRHVKLNAVSVTPLLPMLFNDHQTFVDRMTSIVRMREPQQDH